MSSNSNPAASSRRPSHHPAEASHYVVTAHPPGGILATTQCNFLSPQSKDVIIAKSRRLEVRQYSASSEADEDNPFPLVQSLPIHGRIVCLKSLQLPHQATSYIFFLTDKLRYAVLSYDPSSSSAYNVMTHASGSLSLSEPSASHRLAEAGPLVSVDPRQGCIVLHVYDGVVTILPLDLNYQPPTAMTTSRSATAAALLPTKGRCILGEAYHVRLEERSILDLACLDSTSAIAGTTAISFLYQDGKGNQHLVTHRLDLSKQQWIDPASSNTEGLLKKSRVDGGSSLLLAVPRRVTAAAAANTPVSTTGGGVVLVGQRQLTWVGPHASKVVPLPQCLITSATLLPPAQDATRFLMGDENGHLHLLSLHHTNGQMGLETLGTTNIMPSSLEYLDGSDGKVFVASQMGDSHLVQIHDEPISGNVEEDMLNTDTTYLSILEEYAHLGPIVDFDLVPTHSNNGNHHEGVKQSQVVTCSGVSQSGTLRLIRNGIGMNEYASVEMGGIQNMWSVRKSFRDAFDSYLVQSFVGETRVLGVSSSDNTAAAMEQDDADDEEEEEEGGTLEEVFLEGLESTASSLFVGNVQVGDSIVQITETAIRLIDASTLQCTATWSPTAEETMEEDAHLIIVASGNEAGQIVVALRGGVLLYFCVKDARTIELVHKTKMEKEISCLDLNPFASPVASTSSAMDVDGRSASASSLVAVGLWDDFTVRLLSLDSDLGEILQINLSEEDEEDTGEAEAKPDRRNRSNMMARSLCLVTLDSASSSSSRHTSPSVNMLFVGLGDGTLISFAVLEQFESLAVQSKKQVSLGTQRINLVPLQTERGGTCVLATGDRPTVIYLAGGGGTSASNFSNPKLCYSNVNLSTSEDEAVDDVNRPPAQQSIAVNVATPFFSPDLFDMSSLGSKHYSLCVADDANLRLGVIDDIQKLHVTTCRLGMTPRRVVHCPDGRLFAVGCIESDRVQSAMTMGSCIRFLDDTTFDDIDRIDLEPHEVVTSMVSAVMGTSEQTQGGDSTGEGGNTDTLVGAKPYLLIGTAYALPDEDEPSRGRILVLSCSSDEGGEGTTRKPRHVTELLVRGAVYSMSQFYNGRILATVNSKTQVCQMTDNGGVPKLSFLGIGHHGHILSLFVKSKAPRPTVSSSAKNRSGLDTSMAEETADKAENKEQLAIVGDLMRSISLAKYYPEHEALEEIARDFNANWTTAIEMLTDDIYLGAENWNNLYVLRRNTKAQSEEVRCRLDTVGEYHLGETVNKLMAGSLVMPQSSSNASAASGGRRKVASMRTTSPVKGSSKRAATTTMSRIRRPSVVVGSQTLFATVDGTLGSILGLDARTAVFFATLQRAMSKTIRPVGDLSHSEYRTFEADRRIHVAHGFVDGDLVESFLDLDRTTMEKVVDEMNRDGGWDVLDNQTMHPAEKEGSEEDVSIANDSVLAVEDVLAMVEEMAMVH